MKVFEVNVGNNMYSSEKWLITATSLQLAVDKAQKKLKRAPRLYENYSITSAAIVRGQLLNA